MTLYECMENPNRIAQPLPNLQSCIIDFVFVCLVLRLNIGVKGIKNIPADEKNLTSANSATFPLN